MRKWRLREFKSFPPGSLQSMAKPSLKHRLPDPRVHCFFCYYISLSITSWLFERYLRDISMPAQCNLVSLNLHFNECNWAPEGIVYGWYGDFCFKDRFYFLIVFVLARQKDPHPRFWMIKSKISNSEKDPSWKPRKKKGGLIWKLVKL